MDKKTLEERQKWSLNQKIDHSLGVIDQFYSKLNGDVFISFSGGKDSTALLSLARKIYPDIKGVFCNTGNEYPDIVRFVRDMKNRGENVEIIYPKLKPKQVIEKYGFPIISKDTSRKLYYCKHHKDSKIAKQALTSKSRFTKLPKSYEYILKQPYDVSSFCCDILKKKPFYEYIYDTYTYPIVGTLATESKNREQAYIRAGGCNTFNNRDKRKQVSRPLSIWLEQDIWDYIEKYNIPIAEIYNKGAKRTGCMFCGYGCQFKNDNRLQLVYDLYPKMYDMFMNYTNNGVTYKEVMKDFLATSNIMLPDDTKQIRLDI